MRRREFLRQAAVAAAAAAAPRWLSAFSTPMPVTRKNILFIMSDDHSLQAMGVYPSWLRQFVIDHKLTPNIERLAREGGVFDQSFCCNSICGPSRAAILTGAHSHVNGFMHNSNTFNGAQWTFPKALQGAGYQTAIFGKWHLVSTPTGFDSWEILTGQGTYYNPDFITPAGTVRRNGYTTDLIASRCVDWIEKERDKTKPFLLMCHHKAPHRNWLPPARYARLLDDATVPEPPTLFDDYASRTTPAAKQKMEIGRHMIMGNDLKVGDKDAPAISGSGRMTPEQRAPLVDAYTARTKAFHAAKPEGRDLVRWKFQQYMKDYLRCIKAVDDGVGTLLDCLERNNLSQDTLVVYCSDQGFYNGEHGWFDKRWMYEESLKMPLIMRLPDTIKPGSRFAPMVQNIDYAPTFLDLASVQQGTTVQGCSFLPIMRGQPQKNWRSSIYYHYYEDGGEHNVARHYGVRTARHKLIYYEKTNEWELFDLEKDQNEMKSVYGDPAYEATTKELKKELERLRTVYNDESDRSDRSDRSDKSDKSDKSDPRPS